MITKGQHQHTAQGRLLAVARTMQILELLAQSPDGLSVSGITESTGFQKADVSRILSTLQEGNYVTQDLANSRYTLSWRFIALALKYSDSLELEGVARPILNQLAADTGELVQLAVVQSEEILYVAKVEGVKPLRVASMLGRSAPLHATAVGKVWLANLPIDKAMSLVAKKGLAKVTDKTITDPDLFLVELRKVKELGYAISWEEINPTVVGIAVPVYGNEKAVKAVIVVAIPAFEADEERLQEIRGYLDKVAEKLTRRFKMFDI